MTFAIRLFRFSSILPIAFAVISLSSCTGAQEGLFHINGEEYSVNPSSVASLATSLSAKESGKVIQSSGLVTEWDSSQGDTFASTSGKEPSLTSDSVGQWLTFSAGDTMTATGRFPEHLSTTFSFALVGIFDQGAFKIRFGSDDDTEAMTLSVPASGQMKAEHSSSSGNVRVRTWSNLPVDGKPHIFIIVFGAATKDMELYVDGFHSTDYTFSGTGSANSFQTVARDFKISNTASDASVFRLGQFLVFNEKLGPQTAYGISRYLARSWNVLISGTTTKEIRNNEMPAVMPETVDATYLFSAILTSKCVVCHKTGSGYSPAFETEVLLRSAVDSSHNLIVSPGNSAASALYTSVANNSMPFGGGALSSSEKQLIKDWIDAGAP